MDLLSHLLGSIAIDCQVTFALRRWFVTRRAKQAPGAPCSPRPALAPIALAASVPDGACRQPSQPKAAAPAAVEPFISLTALTALTSADGTRGGSTASIMRLRVPHGIFRAASST